MPNWSKPNFCAAQTWLYSVPNLTEWPPFTHVALPANWPRQSRWMFSPRKLTVPTLPTVPVSSGIRAFASRGRLSREYWPRISMRRLARSADVYSPTIVFVRSFSVPLLDTALIVVSDSALPVALEFSASLLLKL